MQTIMKPSKQSKFTTRNSPYKYRRRVYDVQSPCQWSKHCYDGKCPAFMRIDGNYYCGREGIP